MTQMNTPIHKFTREDIEKAVAEKSEEELRYLRSIARLNYRSADISSEADIIAKMRAKMRGFACCPLISFATAVGWAADSFVVAEEQKRVFGRVSRMA